MPAAMPPAAVAHGTCKHECCCGMNPVTEKMVTALVLPTNYKLETRMDSEGFENVATSTLVQAAEAMFVTGAGTAQCSSPLLDSGFTVAGTLSKAVTKCG